MHGAPCRILVPRPEIKSCVLCIRAWVLTTELPGKGPDFFTEMSIQVLCPFLKCSTWVQSQKQQNDLCSFPRQTIQYHSNPSLCPTGSRRWGAPLVAKVMRKEDRHMQRRDRASGVPLEILEHLPPKPVFLLYCFVLSPTPLTLWGAVPHYLSLKKELTYSSS